MSFRIALLSGLVGYLLGSISFARVIARRVAPRADISRIEQPVPDSKEVFVSDSISATSVRIHLSARYGCLTAILDMAKVAVPTFMLKRWYPSKPYFLVAAGMGVVGHDWPIYHRFKGGRGESPIFGGVLVIDWVAIPATNLIGWPLGLLCGNLLVLRWAGMALLIPWFWLRTRNPAYLAYATGVNVVYWVAMSPELRQYFRLRESAQIPTQEELAEFLGMGKRLGRALDNCNLVVVATKLRTLSEGE
jgi:glycerol-3-phosphate acyltransferase PlsY